MVVKSTEQYVFFQRLDSAPYILFHPFEIFRPADIVFNRIPYNRFADKLMAISGPKIAMRKATIGSESYAGSRTVVFFMQNDAQRVMFLIIKCLPRSSQFFNQ